MKANAGVESIIVERTITRADGTVRASGVVAAYHRNPLKRLVARVRGLGSVHASRR